MKDECLICGAKLQYLENDIEMECTHFSHNNQCIGKMCPFR